jgi:hypothetical protein
LKKKGSDAQTLLSYATKKEVRELRLFLSFFFGVQIKGEATIVKKESTPYADARYAWPAPT